LAIVNILRFGGAKKYQLLVTSRRSASFNNSFAGRKGLLVD